ncbi:MAG: hypothetical protein HBSAPP03_07170 [Phycisphaerae bacterium]|nr:MAG: hypothetical protein HBSAPP03_07170 [Phycisphaerae bacterium]
MAACLMAVGFATVAACGVGGPYTTAYCESVLTAKPVSFSLAQCRTRPTRDERDHEAKASWTFRVPACQKTGVGGRVDVIDATGEWWKGDPAAQGRAGLDGHPDATGVSLHFGSPRGPPGVI